MRNDGFDTEGRVYSTFFPFQRFHIHRFPSAQFQKFIKVSRGKKVFKHKLHRLIAALYRFAICVARGSEPDWFADANPLTGSIITINSPNNLPLHELPFLAGRMPDHSFHKLHPSLQRLKNDTSY